MITRYKLRQRFNYYYGRRRKYRGKLYLRAAKLIEAQPYKLTGQGHYRYPDGSDCYCAAGALAKAAGGSPFDWHMVPLEKLPELDRIIGYRELYKWNDSLLTTKEDISEGLRQAAAYCGVSE